MHVICITNCALWICTEKCVIRKKLALPITELLLYKKIINCQKYYTHFFINPKILREFYTLKIFYAHILLTWWCFLYLFRKRKKLTKLNLKKTFTSIFRFPFFWNNLNKQICVVHGPQNLTSCAISPCQGRRAPNYIVIITYYNWRFYGNQIKNAVQNATLHHIQIRYQYLRFEYIYAQKTRNTLF